MTFRWASPLGVSAALFLSYALFCAAIGIGGPIYLRSGHASVAESLFFTGRAEQGLYGKPTLDLVREAPALLTVRRQLMDVWCAFALALAIAQVAIVWFALRRGEAWALWTLALADIAIVVYYFALLVPAARPHLAWGDVHPFAWYPAIVVPVATLLGWLGLRT